MAWLSLAKVDQIGLPDIYLGALKYYVSNFSKDLTTHPPVSNVMSKDKVFIRKSGAFSLQQISSVSNFETKLNTKAHPKIFQS